MKAIAMILLTVFLGKSCSNTAQNDIAKASLQYVANSRGFFLKVAISDQKATITRDRNAKAVPQEIAISDADWKEIVGYFETIDLEKLPEYKDPTQKRFYDGAAIANLTINYKDKAYETVAFDHGFPPVEIEKLVNKIVSLTKTKE